MTSQALKPRDGSPGHLAMLHLQRTTTATSVDLATALDLPLSDVDRLLKYPVHVGLLARSPEAGTYRYRLGNGVPSTEPIETRPAPPTPAPPPPTPSPALRAAQVTAAPVSPPAKPLRIPTLTKAAAGMAASVAVAKAAAPVAPPAPAAGPSNPATRVPVPAPAPDLGVLGDVRDITAEAANLAGVDIDAPHRRQREQLQVARELVAAVLPVLEVKRFDVARFDNGRLVLDLDGTLYVLPPMLAARLYRYLDGQELAR